MDPYVTPDIQNVRDSPDPGETIALAIVVSESADTQDVAARVRDLGGNVFRELPANVAIVELPETNLAEFCNVDVVESVSRPDRMEVLG